MKLLFFNSRLYFIFLIFILFGFSKHDKFNLINSSWSINVIIIDKDTVFLNKDSLFTFNHNFKINKNYLKSKEDSVKIVELANKSFRNLKSMKIHFDSDSTFFMTKMRSGGRFFLNELDSGIYFIRNDSLLLNLLTRRNYRMGFIFNREISKFYFEEKSPIGQKVYCEYIKNNN